MIKDKIIRKNFIWNTIGTTIASFNSLFLIIITRINGMQDAGIFSITFATASILYIFALYSGRSCHTTDTKGVIQDKDYIVSRAITCLIMFVMMIAFACFNNYGAYKNTILILLCTWRGLEAFADVFYGIMQKEKNLHQVGKSLILKGILGLSLFLIIDLLTKNLIYACFSLCFVSIAVILTYDIPQAMKQTKCSKKVQIKNVITIYKSEFFIFINAFLTMYLLNAPKYAIEKYLTEEIQAVFGIILMPASILPLFAQFVVAPMINKMTQMYKENEIKELKKLQIKIVGFIFLFGIVAITVGYVIGIPVLNLIYQKDLNLYKIPFIMILFAYVIYASGYIKTIILTIYRKIKEQFIVYLIAVGVIYLISDIFVKQYGINGAAFSYLITMTVYYLLFYIMMKIKCKEK